MYLGGNKVGSIARSHQQAIVSTQLLCKAKVTDMQWFCCSIHVSIEQVWRLQITMNNLHQSVRSQWWTTYITQSDHNDEQPTSRSQTVNSTYDSDIMRSSHSSLINPNMTTLRLGLRYRKYVCRLYVCAPYSGGWIFQQYFFTAVYIGHPLTSVQNFTKIVPGEPLSGALKCKRGSKIE